MIVIWLLVVVQGVGEPSHEAGPEPGVAAVLPGLRAGGGVDGRARGVPGAGGAPAAAGRAARPARPRAPRSPHAPRPGAARQRRAAHQETRGLRQGHQRTRKYTITCYLFICTQ